MLTARDVQRLTGAHPALLAAYRSAAERAEADGTPIFIVGCGRTPAFQNALYQQGRTTDGPGKDATHPLGRVVTECDGIKKRSDHQVFEDGYYHAIDFAFVPTKARTNAFDPAWPWKRIAGYVIEAASVQNPPARVEWGGTWKVPADLDHLQIVT